MEMTNKTYDPDVYIKISVESTTNIQAWIPLLIEMGKKGITEVYSQLHFNDDYSNLSFRLGTQNEYDIQITTTVQKFNENLDFFVERTRHGDIISVWKSIEELEELIDEKAEKLAPIEEEPEKIIMDLPIELQNNIDNNLLHVEHQLRFDLVPNRIKELSAEELAAELVEFIKKELVVQGRVWVLNCSRLFWEKQKVNKWACPTEIQIKMSKTEGLAQEIFDSEQVKQKKIKKKSY